MTSFTIKNRLLITGVILFALIELGMLTFWRNILAPEISSIIFFLSGLLTGSLFLVYFYNKKNSDTIAKTNPTWTQKLSVATIVILGVVACWSVLSPTIDGNPIHDFYDPKGSDVIPSMGIIVDRFLNGKFPYYMITEWTFNYPLFPTYLPGFWGAFIIPHLLHIDYRWWALTVWFAVFMWYEGQLLWRGLSTPKLLFLTALPFIFLFCLASYAHSGMFHYSVEPLITAYYILFSLSLLTNSNKLRGGALVLCLLSRYSVVLWLPLFFAVLFLKDKKLDIYKIISILAVGFLILYAPFLMVDYTIFQQGLSHYTEATIGAWTPAPYEISQERPDFLYRGHGCAWFAYENFSGELVDKIKAYKMIHLIVSLATVFLSGLIFLKIKNHIDYRIFLLGALKIYLVVFTHFIQMPFAYLFMVPIFISIPLIGSIFIKKATFNINQ